MPANPAGLYIHLPWCVQKCPYCDFNSHAIKGGLPEAEYVKAIEADLTFEAARIKNRNIGSIFFGGGTPSLFSGQAISSVLEIVRHEFDLTNDIEITLEANPGTAEAGHFDAYRQAGVNRLSLGLQSLDNDMLERLGRIHTAEESLQAYEMARQAGFNNINIDLMFGLPQQTLEHGMDDLEAAISLNPEHLSWYQLTLEPNTRFAAQPPSLPNDDTCHEMQEAGIKTLSTHGYRRYEVSAYSKQGHECQHNLNYWQFGDYLGVGAGAHGKLSHPDPVRYARFKHPNDYIQRTGTDAVYQQHKPIPADELLFEFLLNQLRLVEGFSLQHMQETIGTTPDALKNALTIPIEQGLIELEDLSCRASVEGFRYLNEIFIACLPTKTT
ncbi:MAG: radical SAM family heme chaperone HemW [Gammaproteobacteria bacterium]|nr:radical SAM family heme chaperone HemW [Gammaproteobacteria bacterium]